MMMNDADDDDVDADDDDVDDRDNNPCSKMSFSGSFYSKHHIIDHIMSTHQ